MTKQPGPTHVVVDGSNIATEGRSMPSLAQLNEAVLAYMDEHPNSTVTVVVDATFGHRIDKSEVKEFDAAVANNELVAPPAGAVGRGDAFVLGIADKAGATVLSNDSFQEFHGDYDWLFDEGRLVGGKPVPNVGWVFVNRVPVRGPVSRKAVRDSQREPSRPRRARGATTARTGSKEASQPMPVPKAPPPSRAAAPPAESRRAASTTSERVAPAAPSGDQFVNDLMPFLEFVEHHPVGTSVNATVESYSSHGAYVTIGDVRGYVPLRLMSDPPPRSAREVMKVGDAVTLVVADFAPAKRSIDCAVPHMAAGIQPEDPADVIDAVTASVAAADAPTSRPSRRRSKKAAARAAERQSEVSAAEQTTDAAGLVPATPVETTTPARSAPARKSPAKKAPAKKSPAKKSPAKKAPAKKVAAGKAPAKAPARKAAARTAPAEHAPAAAAPTDTAPAKKSAAKKASAKAAPSKEAPATKSAATKSTARKSTATKAPAKKSAAKKSAAKKAPVTKRAANAATPGSAADGTSRGG